MPTYVCSSHLFSGLCSKLPSKYLPEEKKNRSTCSSRCIRGFCKFCIAPKNLMAPRPQSRTHCKVHFRWGLHVCPEESWNWKKKIIFTYNKDKYYTTKQIFWREQSRGPKWQGEEDRREKTQRARSRGHVHLPFSVAIRDIPLNH